MESQQCGRNGDGIKILYLLWRDLGVPEPFAELHLVRNQTGSVDLGLKLAHLSRSCLHRELPLPFQA